MTRPKNEDQGGDAVEAYLEGYKISQQVIDEEQPPSFPKIKLPGLTHLEINMDAGPQLTVMRFFEILSQIGCSTECLRIMTSTSTDINTVGLSRIIGVFKQLQKLEIHGSRNVAVIIPPLQVHTVIAMNRTALYGISSHYSNIKTFKLVQDENIGLSSLPFLLNAPNLEELILPRSIEMLHIGAKLTSYEQLISLECSRNFAHLLINCNRVPRLRNLKIFWESLDQDDKIRDLMRLLINLSALVRLTFVEDKIPAHVNLSLRPPFRVLAARQGLAGIDFYLQTILECRDTIERPIVLKHLASNWHPNWNFLHDALTIPSHLVQNTSIERDALLKVETIGLPSLPHEDILRPIVHALRRDPSKQVESLNSEIDTYRYAQIRSFNLVLLYALFRKLKFKYRSISRSGGCILCKLGGWNCYGTPNELQCEKHARKASDLVEISAYTLQ
jgi:hypothetical protein